MWLDMQTQHSLQVNLWSRIVREEDRAGGAQEGVDLRLRTVRPAMTESQIAVQTLGHEKPYHFDLCNAPRDGYEEQLIMSRATIRSHGR